MTATISTIDQLRTLTDGAIIKEARGRNIAQLITTDDFRTWFYTGSDKEYADEEVHLPARVIHAPNMTA